MVHDLELNNALSNLSCNMRKPTEDPLLRSGRREALAVMATWLAALSYTVTYSYKHGYGRALEDLRFVLGFPDWVFWGVLLPWGICFLVSYLFSHVFMTDGDLGENRADSTPDQQRGRSRD